MQNRFVLFVALMSLLICSRMTVSALAVEDRVIQVAKEDAEMNQAIVAARLKLPHFWKVQKAPTNGETEFSLKVRITDGEKTEYFWCVDIRVEKGVVTGEIGNDAEVVKSVHIGQRIPIKESDIADWLYIKDDKMIGNYTVRPLMKSMSKEELKFLKGKLGELPKD